MIRAPCRSFFFGRGIMPAGAARRPDSIRRRSGSPDAVTARSPTRKSSTADLAARRGILRVPETKQTASGDMMTRPLPSFSPATFWLAIGIPVS